MPHLYRFVLRLGSPNTLASFTSRSFYVVAAWSSSEFCLPSGRIVVITTCCRLSFESGWARSRAAAAIIAVSFSKAAARGRYFHVVVRGTRRSVGRPARQRPTDPDDHRLPYAHGRIVQVQDA